MSKSVLDKTTVAGYIRQQLDFSQKTQVEVAKEVGFDKPNMITMIKQGKTRLPLDKAGKFAKAIGSDPIFLFKLALKEYFPEAYLELEKAMKQQPALTEYEVKLIHIIRKSKNLTPIINNSNDEKRIIEMINSLPSE